MKKVLKKATVGEVDFEAMSEDVRDAQSAAKAAQLFAQLAESEVISNTPISKALAKFQKHAADLEQEAVDLLAIVQNA